MNDDIAAIAAIEKDIRDMSPEEKEALANRQLAEQAAADAAKERRRRDALTATLSAMVAQAEAEAATAEREAAEAETAAAGGEAAWRAYAARCEAIEAAIGSGDGTACGSLLDALCADLGLPGLRPADRDAIQLGVSGLAIAERHRVASIDQGIAQLDASIAELEAKMRRAREWLDADAAKPPDAAEDGDVIDVPAAIRDRAIAAITAAGLTLPDCLKPGVGRYYQRDLRHIDAILATVQRTMTNAVDPEVAAKREALASRWMQAGERVRSTTAGLERILLGAMATVDARSATHDIGALRPLVDADGTRLARHIPVEPLADVDSVLAAVGAITLPTPARRKTGRKTDGLGQPISRPASRPESRPASRDHRQQRRSGAAYGGALTREGMKAVRELIDTEEGQPKP